MATPREVAAALERAQQAYVAWGSSPLPQRGELMQRLADRLEQAAPQLAQLMALEMGKPVVEGEAEAAKCAWVCRFFADEAESYLTPTPHASDGSQAYVRYDPLGPILAIMPWNFPLWQLLRFAAPAIMAGNVVLMKHAPRTPQCALRLESLFQDAGAPDGVLQNLFLDNDQCARVMADPVVRGVTLTGSTRAGRSVAQTAGRHLKPVVLELGGSDPFIVLEDADVTAAAQVAVTSRCLNAGQSCIASKRFLVDRRVHVEFTEQLIAGMQSRVPGDPRERSTTMGPLARDDLRAQLHSQVEQSVAAGARLACGGTLPEGPGFFYPPTVLTEVTAGSPAADEELFGPVAAVMAVDNERQAIELANATDYGLGASLWTQDLERAHRLIPRVEAGNVFVNGMVKSDPRLPFGGTKDSGYGRELARAGMLEWVNAKTVWIA